jgi:hypothetical protein
VRTFKIPLLLGNMIGIGGLVLAAYLILVADLTAEVILSFFLYVVACACLVFFPHGLSHYVVGRLAGIRFTYYSVGKSAVRKLRLPFVSATASKVPVLTLRTDQGTLFSVSPQRRAAMFAAGAAASMLLPFISFVASLKRLPVEFSGVLFLICLTNAMFDIYYSPKAGDIARAKAAAGKA